MRRKNYQKMFIYIRKERASEQRYLQNNKQIAELINY
jgi:hypothetical protein